MTPQRKKKRVKHRHKWQVVYNDCAFCGGGEYFECECGDMRYADKKTPL